MYAANPSALTAIAERNAKPSTKYTFTVTAISAGVGYSCAILAEGELKCWGGDSWYRLGYGAPGGGLDAGERNLDLTFDENLATRDAEREIR